MTAAILPLLTEAQVADLLGLSIRTLQAWRLHDSGPPYVRLADDGKRGTVRYRQQDIQAFIESRAIVVASVAGGATPEISPLLAGRVV